VKKLSNKNLAAKAKRTDVWINDIKVQRIRTRRPRRKRLHDYGYKPIGPSIVYVPAGIVTLIKR